MYIFDISKLNQKIMERKLFTLLTPDERNTLHGQYNLLYAEIAMKDFFDLKVSDLMHLKNTEVIPVRTTSELLAVLMDRYVS